MGIIKDPTSWRTGFELGLAGFSFPYSKPRKPTAYLYNGIRLPALPEWDRGVYPYACIDVKPFLEDRKRLVCFADRPYISHDDGDGSGGYRSASGKMLWCYYADGSEEWGTFQEVTSGAIGFIEMVWSSFDFLKEDGTVYLAASEPVPFYE